MVFFRPLAATARTKKPESHVGLPPPSCGQHACIPAAPLCSPNKLVTTVSAANRRQNSNDEPPNDEEEGRTWWGRQQEEDSTSSAILIVLLHRPSHPRKKHRCIDQKVPFPWFARRRKPAAHRRTNPFLLPAPASWSPPWDRPLDLAQLRGIIIDGGGNVGLLGSVAPLEAHTNGTAEGRGGTEPVHRWGR